MNKLLKMKPSIDRQLVFNYSLVVFLSGLLMISGCKTLKKRRNDLSRHLNQKKRRNNLSRHLNHRINFL
jgi:hypothetical protein